jgi:hypothetical protein
MEIYKYYTNTEEWQNLINTTLNGQNAQNVFEQFIRENGVKVSIQEYFNDFWRNSSFRHGYSYECFGDAENCIERLAKGEIDFDNDLFYCIVKDNFSEDLCENRTDWDELKSYADGLYNFIDALKNEIANGKLKL